MSKRALTLLSFIAVFSLLTHSGYGQSPVDPYKYVIVPKKFDFLKKENQYRVNSQTKFHFAQNGFQTVLMGEEYPADLRANPCLGARANVIDESNSFTTKLRVSLTNCHDEVVYTSEQGISKEKSYDKTYSEALEMAFESIGELKYQYRPELSIKPQATAAAVSSAEPEVSAEPAAPAEPASAAEPEAAVQAVVPAAAVVEEATAEIANDTNDANGAASSYGNENISFFLIEQGDQLVAYVIRSESGNYSKGEKIGTFQKTSLPNVYRVEWKGMDEDIEQTTGYFDDKGNLKIDVKRDGKIEVLLFEKE